jgi:hypothetical protein
MMAALRQPTNGSVIGLLSAVMTRPETGSASIAVFGTTSAPRHCRSINRPVSMTGPLDRGSVTPGLSGGNIGLRPPILFTYRRDGEEHNATKRSISHRRSGDANML